MKKEDGGLGLKDLDVFKHPLLTRQIWHLAQREESLAFYLLKTRYFPRSSSWDATLGHRSSFTWRMLVGCQGDGCGRGALARG